MSTSTGTTVEHSTHPSDVEAHDHPSDRRYVKIAVVLAVLTALEVATYFFEDELGMGGLLAILIPLMIVKFAIVAGYFMHLKFDSALFTRMFVAGIVLAVAVYAAMLAAFRIWEF